MSRGARRAALYRRRLYSCLAEGAALRLLGAVRFEEVARVARRGRGVLWGGCDVHGAYCQNPSGNTLFYDRKVGEMRPRGKADAGSSRLDLREGEAVFSNGSAGGGRAVGASAAQEGAGEAGGGAQGGLWFMVLFVSLYCLQSV